MAAPAAPLPASPPTPPPPSGPLPAASVGRRIAAMLYEAVVVAAVIFIASLLFHGAATGRLVGASRLAFQIYLVAVLGLYFVWFWQRGQTLPMRAWRLRLVARDGGPVTPTRALARFLAAAAAIGTSFVAALYLREHPDAGAAWAAVVPGPLSVAWALADRDRQALYDRIAGTRLVLPLFHPPHHPDRGEQEQDARRRRAHEGRPRLQDAERGTEMVQEVEQHAENDPGEKLQPHAS